VVDVLGENHWPTGTDKSTIVSGGRSWAANIAMMSQQMTEFLALSPIP
jgi:hypothetical protein